MAEANASPEAGKRSAMVNNEIHAALEDSENPRPLPQETALQKAEPSKEFLNGTGNKLRDLTGIVDRDEHRYIGGGAFGDVYRGIWKEEAAGGMIPSIVVKVFRSTGTVDPEASTKRLKVLRREVTVWHSLNHENIVPFVGIALISGALPSIVSTWMSQGSLRFYLGKHPTASRIKLVVDIANGLKYLHDFEPSIIHGDLKADNVLVDENENARLCDFGLSRMIEDSTLWNTSATTAAGTVRWKAPELLNGNQRTVTRHSDMYAYGMTCFEIYSGRLPFHQYGNDGMVIKAVLLDGEVPDRKSLSQNIHDEIWNIWARCWDRDPRVRPAPQEVLDTMQKLLPNVGQTQSSRKPTNNGGIDVNGITVHSARWSGKLCWQGVDRLLNLHTEMDLFVEIDMEIDEPRCHLWPSVLNLSPVEIPSSGFSSIEQMIKVNNTGCAVLRAAGAVPEEKRESERNYMSLRSLLFINRVVAATAGFPDPENNNQPIVLVVFPPAIPGATMKLNGAILPQQVVTNLNQLSSKDRQLSGRPTTTKS